MKELRVLLADDQKLVRELIASAYESLGLRGSLEYAEGDRDEIVADDAVGRIGNFDYAAVISDGLNGYWKRIYEALLDKSRLYVLSGTPEIVKEASSLGLKAYQKPSGMFPMMQQLKEDLLEYRKSDSMPPEEVQ
jgi:CheY-like chemotaxis protein